MDTNQAQQFGRSAQLDSRICAPVQDTAFMESLYAEIEGQPVGTSIPYLEAWHRGWLEEMAIESGF